uniref:peptidylprolyl isomerase n=1 Tax=Strigops habroptila TaxID=2489341 RepID=A0A672V0W0_STRHB
MAGPAAVRRRGRCCGALLVLPAVLVSWAACQAPPVPAAQPPPDGAELRVERRFVPESCPRAVRPGDFVRYHYLGSFPDGTRFDSSYDRGSTFNVFVGKGQLIAGMDQALVGMCVNERRFVQIPPKLAYGSEGVSGVIPPNAVLHFDVLLIDLWNLEDEVQVQTYFKPEKCPRTVQVSDFVRYHYNGTFLDGTLFDSSHNRMRTYDTYVGIGWLIPGMEQGLLGMCVGEKRIITIPPFLAYGEEGDGKEIPGQASLVFDVVLLDLHNPKDGIAIENQHVPESCERRSQAGDFLRYHYNGTLLDGTLFDSSYSRNRTYDTYVGQGYVIAGMDEGLLGVCTGEKRRIIIPPHLGYGEEGRGELDFSLKSSKGDYLKYHYKCFAPGCLGKTYNMSWGPGQVVVGMDMGLQDMCVGERRTVVIPPHLGYGEDGCLGVYPVLYWVFDIELLELVSGLPEGYMFGVEWGTVFSPFPSTQFSEYIQAQVDSGKGKLAPGFDFEKIVKNMFTNQDRDGNGKVTAEEFKLKDQEAKEEHDEL